jgi:hypothetical protein
VLTTLDDLRNWVDGHIGHYPATGDLEAVTKAIVAGPSCPRWGDDWAGYLEQLDVFALLPGYEEGE